MRRRAGEVAAAHLCRRPAAAPSKFAVPRCPAAQHQRGGGLRRGSEQGGGRARLLLACLLAASTQAAHLHPDPVVGQALKGEALLGSLDVAYQKLKRRRARRLHARVTRIAARGYPGDREPHRQRITFDLLARRSSRRGRAPPETPQCRPANEQPAIGDTHFGWPASGVACVYAPVVAHCCCSPSW